MTVKRPGRTAGVLPVVEPRMRQMTAKEKKKPAKTVLHKERRVSGGDRVQRSEAAGETLAKRATTAVTVVNRTIAVLTAATETSGRSVKSEPHPEIMMREALGDVEVMRRRRSGQKKESGNPTLTQREKRVPGVLTKIFPVASRTIRMMTAGPQSAAEQQPLHLMASDHENLVGKREKKFSIQLATVVN